MILLWVMLALIGRCSGQPGAFTVTPSNKEVKTGTDVVLSCSISGISAPVSVLWKKSGEADLSNSVIGYSVAAGTFGSGSQVSTLTLTAAVNTADTTFTCVVTAPGTGQTAQETTVQLDVFEDCNKPSLLLGSVAPNTASIASGAAYTATCNSGHTLVGSNTMTCNLGTLSPIPTCAEDCSEPAIPFGTLIPSTPSISSGAEYTVTCATGFTLVGSDTMTCTEGTLSAPPTCTEDCNKPSITKGWTSPFAPSISSGEAYTVTCNSGYTLFGIDTMDCIAGTLAPIPTCKEDCIKPSILSGSVVPNSATIPSGEDYFASCDSGYTLVGSSTVACSEGSLTTFPTCTKDCNKPSLPLGSVAPNTASISSGAAYTATCNSGHTLAGSDTATCTEGTLSEVPTCTEDCSEPSIPFGTLNPSTPSISSGAEYTVTCNTGYTLVGQDTMTCTEGTLSAPPTCTPGVCSKPSIQFGSVTPNTDSISSGTAYTATCDSEYTLVGSDTVTCNLGTLSPIPTCAGFTIQVMKGKCRRGKIRLCKLKCIVTLVSGDAPKKSKISWMKEGTPDKKLPRGRLRRGVYTAAVPKSWSPVGDYYCQYIDDNDVVHKSASEISVSLRLPKTDSITVTADVRGVNCVEEEDCRISCSLTGVDFRKNKYKPQDDLMVFYKKNPTTGSFEAMLSKQAKIQKARILLRWESFDIDSNGDYKCEYDGVKSEAITLTATPICHEPMISGGSLLPHISNAGKPKPAPASINVGESYTVKCDKDKVMAGSDTMICSGADNTPGVLSTAPTCTIPPRSVTAAQSTVECTLGAPCSFTCKVNGVVPVIKDGVEIDMTKRLLMLFKHEDGGNWSILKTPGRSTKDGNDMTLNFKRAKLTDAGKYKCAYKFGTLGDSGDYDEVDSEVITVNVE